jgi:hypothetical protein
MIRTIFIVSVIFFSLSASATDSSIELMPVPAYLKHTGENFRITGNFTIAVTGNPGERVYKEASRSLRRFDNRMGFFFRQENISI